MRAGARTQHGSLVRAPRRAAGSTDRDQDPAGFVKLDEAGTAVIAYPANPPRTSSPPQSSNSISEKAHRHHPTSARSANVLPVAKSRRAQLCARRAALRLAPRARPRGIALQLLSKAACPGTCSAFPHGKASPPHRRQRQLTKPRPRRSGSSRRTYCRRRGKRFRLAAVGVADVRERVVSYRLSVVAPCPKRTAQTSDK